MNAADVAAGTAVRLENVVFSYGEEPMHFDVAFVASARTALMGPSGSGKSTLLNLIAGFEEPQSGRILAGDRDITRLAPARRPVSMIFQENNLFPHLDVAANIGLGISPALRLSRQDHDRIAGALERTGLAGKELRLPRELSGGERQRVALARALVRDHPILLLDEPFASLGPALRTEMLDLLAEVQGERQMTVILVSHLPGDARRIADNIVFLEAGRVAASGPTDSMFGEQAPTAFRRYIGDRQVIS